MAEGTKLEIVSPEKLLLSETVKSVTVPGADGYFTVLGDHAPFMTTMKPGFVTVVDNAGISHVYYVRGGFADVSPEGLTILAEEAQDIAEFDRAKIEGLIAAGLTAQQAATTADEEMRLQEEIDGWRNLLLDASVGTSATAH
ncbi:MAG: F0F1 ATP synthase subunit epsilon [Devosia sp.]|uniref:F0F1 ATP synthase subunit epsilon n=1 Tax=Devosia sp. TaxID=1871048 RepID=UPI001AC21D71|nr:F0F1 ATP synthase subunit epsilon [Devosia sp.]MBN9317067.1 F0F1 ATP synthase subunit epsilon [Devosia sp.]